MLNSLLKIGKVWLDQQKPLSIHHEKCTHARHKSSTCRYCLDICPVNAITIDHGPVVDWNCNGCSLCTSVCPTEALELKKESLVDYYTKIKKHIHHLDNELLITCNHSPASISGLSFLCLGEIDDLAIQLAIANGICKIYFYIGACEHCKLEVGKALFDRRLQLWKEKWDEVEWVEINDEVDFINNRENIKKKITITNTDKDLIDRREFFKVFGNESKKLMIQTVINKKEETPWKKGELAQQHSVRLQVYQQWIKPKENQPFALARGNLSINDKCTACGICEKLCPTAAIHIDTQAYHHSIDQTSCIQCNLCKDVCHRKAIDDD